MAPLGAGATAAVAAGLARAHGGLTPLPGDAGGKTEIVITGKTKILLP